MTAADQTNLWSTIGALVGGLGIGTLVTQLLSGWQTRRRESATRDRELRARQLQELYGPLLSLHQEIRAHSELRVKLQTAVFQSKMAADDVLKNVLDENETFRQVLMPRYREMAKLFQEKIWLAEPETRKHFPSLIEFIQVWERVLDGRFPRELARQIGHTEENLKPFYFDLEEKTDSLRRRIGG
jgi:hypothetical protein